MDKTHLVAQVVELFQLAGHKVDTSVKINHREIDVVATPLQGLARSPVLVECADYKDTVGVDKMQTDLNKLEAARRDLGRNAILFHVSRNGYSPEAIGMARSEGIDAYPFDELVARLVNFDPFLEFVESDQLRPLIGREYQATPLNYDGDKSSRAPALKFAKQWLAGSGRWLTVLGDYGVGKSWFLRRLMYEMVADYKADPSHAALPFLIPLQRFAKSFNFDNLIQATLAHYNIQGVPVEAFKYLASVGRVVFLLDAFDEMAQALDVDAIRENLHELLTGVRSGSKVIMTSRPNYFEGRAERLLMVESNGELQWHPIDREVLFRSTSVARALADYLSDTQYARLGDLTDKQRAKLFAIVLDGKPKALTTLQDLYGRFSNLEHLSQRAVIARLLTTVAETLSSNIAMKTPDGFPLIPEDLHELNEAKVFEIVVNNLLARDVNIGRVQAKDRLRFLRAFAVSLQSAHSEAFASPEEIRALVREVFAHHLSRTDTPEADLDRYYRTCRRHSGLTTEGQYLDTSGNIDLPVEEHDTESRVGFSHNSLREYLVAEALREEILAPGQYAGVSKVRVTPAIGGFLVGLAQNRSALGKAVAARYSASAESDRVWLFRVILSMIQVDSAFLRLLGSPPDFSRQDLVGADLSGMDLAGATFAGSLLGEADLRKTDLRNAKFDGAIVETASMDDARVGGADFTKAEYVSILATDVFDSGTLMVMKGTAARQWLFSNGALVRDPDSLNPFLGRSWYEATREVARTLTKRIAGTHNDAGLVNGVDERERSLASEFVDFLVSCGVLTRVKKVGSGNAGKWVVEVAAKHRAVVSGFEQSGTIDPILWPFFEKELTRRGLPLPKEHQRKTLS